MRGFKFQMNLKVIVCKEIENSGTKHLPQIYLNPKTHIVINDLGINDILENFHQKIVSSILKLHRESSGWIVGW